MVSHERGVCESERCMSWRDRAACHVAIVRGEADPSWWFPPESHAYLYRRAKPICDSCPVRMECLEECFATEALRGLRNGMWAGTLPDERRRMGGDRRRVVQCVWCFQDFETRVSHPSKTCSNDCRDKWISKRKSEHRKWARIAASEGRAVRPAAPLTGPNKEVTV